MPMGMADIAQVLWTKHLKYNPQILIGLIEIGLFYPMDMVPCFLFTLHLTGYDLSIDELKNFRQLGSKTPDIRDVRDSGVETTPVPLDKV